MSKKKEVRVAELFAGVGGFRLGLEDAKGTGIFKVVWSNQWEPATKRQHASEVYVERFGKEDHSNEDIAKVKTREVPDHDLLVGGFPCQDYSVARTLGHAAGLVGKKGVLWWQIHRILKEKGPERPKYLLLENVDRLLKSPANQRGRDFAIMLASLSDLGYAVEWRVINAADYGMPQRRRRVFILGYLEGSRIHKSFVTEDPDKWVTQTGVGQDAFPVESIVKKEDFSIQGKLSDLTSEFNKDNFRKVPFMNAGWMIKRKVFTFDVKPAYKGKPKQLGDVLIPEREVPEEFFVAGKDLPKWVRLKGAKRDERKTKDGFAYSYSEGPMAFPEPLDKPSRTIVTGEGGSTPSRFKHVVKTPSGRYRRLTPIEIERLSMFPENHTKMEGISDAKRAFFMGNALVVGVITKFGNSLLKMM